ncbi:hypothetical protein PRIPAC_87734 [Pristionchus pacificus]|uniref:Uncharacterized protein n=1 Tax=Pristionchus pacificus TaxID=54126 RepID=A0A2A6B880_PRIPA|nr:hypothetical protein PRIPAC_87734 [Pristionchus pacificus]|eukprot:PDM62075.1 hypothetical protein PRIPAC_51517 [Pristionchus pacificus]
MRGGGEGEKSEILDNPQLLIHYEAVCDRVGQYLAQLKILDSLKLCELGFSRVLMTMDIFILHSQEKLKLSKFGSRVNFAILPPVDFLTFIDPSLLPEGGERAWGIERAQREGRGHARETRVDQEIGSRQLFLRVSKSRKTVFDVTAYGANGRPTC